ncbi:substrate-binding periplasmic protein [Undibacterium sp. Ji67W]|uniref:substrate-binding periplasmic protein n=1 Tax=Undibacterium sp. Ji67W TaxID=3413042 RepID=UPI003BF19680
MRSKIFLFISLFLIGHNIQAQNIRVVTEENAYAFMQDGKVSGPATKVAELSLQNAGFTDYKVNIYPWARSYELALKVPNVLIYTIIRTPERENLFKWTGELMKIHFYLYKLKERNDISLNNLNDAKRYTIGVIRDDVRHQYLVKEGFQKLVISAQSIDSFDRLINRQVDLVPFNDDDPQQLCKAKKFDCDKLERVLTLNEMSTGMYMAFSLSTPDSIVERTQKAFEKLKADGTVKKIMSN